MENTLKYMMQAYGICQCCREEGALWKHEVKRKRFFFFGKLITFTRYYCDECGD